MLLVFSLSLAVFSTCVATSFDARHIDWPTWASHVSLNHGNCSHVLQSPLRFQLYLATKAAVEAQNQRSTRGESGWDAAIISTAMLIPGDRNRFDVCEPETEWMEMQLRQLLGYAILIFSVIAANCLCTFWHVIGGSCHTECFLLPFLRLPEKCRSTTPTPVHRAFSPSPH